MTAVLKPMVPLSMKKEGEATIGEWLGRLLNEITRPGVRRVIAYISTTRVIKMTRQRRGLTREQTATILLTFGRPNYAERQFILKARRQGQEFPIEKLQLTYYPNYRRPSEKVKP